MSSPDGYETAMVRIAACREQQTPTLDLSGLGLADVPPEVCGLDWLMYLDLSDNDLVELPDELARLSLLADLDVSRNDLLDMPDVRLGFGALRDLNLSGNLLEELPALQWSQLEQLILDDNPLGSSLSHDRLPTTLRHLSLANALLVTVPPGLTRCSRLWRLNLDGNRLEEVPEFFQEFQDLEELILLNNRLTSIPTFLGDLPKLRVLNLEGNPLTFPPPAVVAGGFVAVRDFLRGARGGGVRQWTSKIVVVGEGRVGKTSLLRALRGEEHDPYEETTHGLAVGRLDLEHPAPPEGEGVTMQLATWDFGGQEIYHATHQFFLTDRSLFLLLWDAQAGWEAGKLHYWLDLIKARAPEAPVVLVATHLGPRPPDLPLSELRSRYPHVIMASLAADSATGEGVDAVRECIRERAAELPLMGARWPGSWLVAADSVRGHPAKYIDPEELTGLMTAAGVEPGDPQDSLTSALHSLGDLLYYPDDEELRDLVVLRPQWLTSYISRVLDSHEVLADRGVFRHAYGDELWADVGRPVRRHFIPMMERFDLSYRTEDGSKSLVVELLPWEPAAYQEPWRAAEGQRELRIRYHLHTVPPGIPTWFLARSHRFSTGLHWRSGALFAHPDGVHLGLVTVDRHGKTAELRVRGPYPNDFFVVLRDGFEQTLARYPGLGIERTVPCPSADFLGQECGHEFKYDHLVARITRRSPLETIECPEDYAQLSVRTLLQGVAPPDLLQTSRLVAETRAQLVQLRAEIAEVGRRVGEEGEQSRAHLGAVLADQQREFLTLQRAGQSRQEVVCPGVITVEQVERRKFLLTRKLLRVHLYCEAPGEWHRLDGVEPYEVPVTSERTAVLLPIAQRVLGVLKYAVPVVGAGLGLASEDLGKLVKDETELVKALLDGMPEEFRQSPSVATTRAERHSEYRALFAVLDELDPGHVWGGLNKVTSPEGHTYWLCERHARVYRPVGTNALPGADSLPAPRIAPAPEQRALGQRAPGQRD